MMKSPNDITPPSSEQPQNQSQQPSSASIGSTTASVTIPVSSQPIITKAQTIVATTAQVQQAPLALTTQPQNLIRPQIQTAPIHLQPQTTSITTTSATATTTTTQSATQQQQIVPQTKVQSSQPPTTTTITPPTVQSITLAAAPTTTCPTALVIIPQHSTNASANPTKVATKVTPITTTVNVATTHVNLSATTQSTPIQLQTPIHTHVANITAPVPLTAHQQSATVVQSTLTNRPPTSLPIVPITTATANIKTEPNKYICCLLDNGIRCDRVAGNASFSARIQKIVGTKKMNFALDTTVRHAYICEHHKAIITVAKKSTTLARDTKSNAKNYTANNNANNTTTQQLSNYNDLTRQQTLQHPVNIELLTNQNRLANNHAGSINNLPVRSNAQIAYTHYPGPLPNQVAPMDVMMSSSFDNTHGLGSGEGAPSSSGGVDVDLQQLQVNTLRRYKRHFRVQTRPGLNKMQLAESLKGHFRTLPIIEKEAITYFVYIVKCYRNKLDHNPKAD